jgi:tetratricopeptide (TPR) repeat protein
LADDLRRFQEHRPIAARPAGAVEKARKWSRRNPAATALVAVVLLAVAGGAIGAWLHIARLNAALEEIAAKEELAQSQKQRADANYLGARQSIDTMLSTIRNEASAGKFPYVYQVFLKQNQSAITFYRTAHDQQPDDADVTYALANAYYNAGVTFSVLGKREEAVQHYRDALQFFDAWRASKFSAQSSDWRLIGPIAMCYRELGLTLGAAKATDALAMLDKCVHICEDQAAGHPTNAAISHLLAITYNERGRIQRQTRHLDRAEADFRQAIAVQTAALERTAANKSSELGKLADMQINLGLVLWQTERIADADMVYGQAEASVKAAEADGGPLNYDIGASAGMLYLNWGTLATSVKDLALAEERFAKGLAVVEPLLKREPQHARLLLAARNSLGAFGQLLRKQGRFAEEAVVQERWAALAQPEDKNAGVLAAALAWARAGDYRRATPYAEALSGFFKERAQQMLLVKVAGLSAAAAKSDAGTTPDVRDKTATKLIALALAEITRVRGGCSNQQWQETIAAINKDDDFVDLRGHPEFQLLVEAEFNGKA